MVQRNIISYSKIHDMSINDFAEFYGIKLYVYQRVILKLLIYFSKLFRFDESGRCVGVGLGGSI